MGLNISLFIHGVPMGQKVYGPKGDDLMYINSFYGPKWDAPELLKVDVMAFGGTTYCYYSFVKGMNVCDSQGRIGSYFAITLRINALYTDIKNVYSILKAAYAKMCVGLCINDDGSIIKYRVSEFDSIEPQLMTIEQHIINYISEFSVSEDIVSTNGLNCNSNAHPIAINLHECTQSVAIKSLQSSGKLSVSPFYPSSQAAAQIAMYQTEIQNVQKRAKQEIEDTSHSYEEKIRQADTQHRQNLQECTEQAEIRVRKAKEDGEKKINEINARYAEIDAKIENLKDEKKQADNKNKILQSEIKEKEDSISRLEKKLGRYDDDMTKMQKQINDLKNRLANQLSDAPIVNSGDFDGGDIDENPLINLKKALFYLGLFFILAFVVLGAYFAWDWHSSRKSGEDVGSDSDNAELVQQATEANVPESKPGRKINVTWGKTEGAIGLNEKLTVALDGDSLLFVGGAKWSSEELDITDNKISVKKGCASDSVKLFLILDSVKLDSVFIPIKK